MSEVLVIAGCDSSGGAGIVRDVRTLTQFGARASCALTAVTAQTDTGVSAVQVLPESLVRAQIATALMARPIAAIKIGMLGSVANVRAVAEMLATTAVPVVLDPVLAASSGATLLEPEGIKALRELLLPRVTLITPNVPELAILLRLARAQTAARLQEQGTALLALGAGAVLLKGGHADGAESIDILLSNTDSPQLLRGPRVACSRRGSGCALASAVAAGLAQRLDLVSACVEAKTYMNDFFQHGK